MELRSCSNTNYGKIGEKAPFKDTNGDNLYIGDVVVTQHKDRDIDEERSVVCKDERNNFGVMGIFYRKRFDKEDEWHVYKEKSYKSMKAGDEIGQIKYVEDEKEMTIQEIEKELGYSIKIVKEK